MIIEETENSYDMHVDSYELEDGTPVIEFMQEGDLGIENNIGIDKQQAAQLIEVLEKWINGEDIE